MCKGHCVRCVTLRDESHQHARTPELMVTCGIFHVVCAIADVWDPMIMVVRKHVCDVLVLVGLILFEWRHWAKKWHGCDGHFGSLRDLVGFVGPSRPFVFNIALKEPTWTWTHEI